MRFASLGSGSEGNALIVEAGGATRPSRLMLDCGFGLREIERRLARHAVEPDSLDAILVTHEHSDHVGGVYKLAARHGVPVYLSHGTRSATAGSAPAGVELRVVDVHTPFAIGEIEVLPYPVPHDAREPVQFAFGDGAVRLGVLTDAGRSTTHIVRMLSGCDALVLECNHDVDMLRGSDYPPSLKARIAGEFGHLSNAESAAILASLDRSRLRFLFAAHLSRRNNRPDIAREALAGVLGCRPDEVGVADQDDGFAWVTL